MKLSALKPNTRNPRKISPEALGRLCASIERDPQFMELRPIIIDDDSIIIGGNQRYTACKKLGMKTIPESWVRKASGLTPEQRKRFIVVDNAPDGMAGEWDMDMLAEDWVVDELLDVGFDLQADSLSRPEGEAAGASPWDRVGDASEGVMFSFGAVQRRLPTSIYEEFCSNVKAETLEEWLNETLSR
jgi:hypothetical protein